MANWSCAACTFAGNPAIFLACSVCSSPRPAPSQPSGTVDLVAGSNTTSSHRAAISTNTATASASRTAAPAVATSTTSKSTKKSHAHQSDQQLTVETALDESRRPPRHTAIVKNLSDREYCCVWSVEVFSDAYRPDVARMLLATVARHVNPVLRDRGWRCKRLIESASPSWIGLCTANGRDDADAASVNIQLNLRWQPDKKCPQFRPFGQILAVMLHEITHTKIGLEDIHPPAFWELLEEIKGEYRDNLMAGNVALERHDYGCQETIVTANGQVKTIHHASQDVLRHLGVPGVGTTTTTTGSFQEDECGAKKRRKRWGGRRRRRCGTTSKGYQSNVPKKRPLLKGKKMVDGRTKHGKAAKAERQACTPQELAARAALARFGGGQPTTATAKTRSTKITGSATSSGSKPAELLVDEDDDGSDTEHEYESGGDDQSDGEDDDSIEPHQQACGCRACDWERMLFVPTPEHNPAATRRVSIVNRTSNP